MRNAFVLAILAICPAAASAGGLLDLKGKAIDDYTIDLQGRYWFGKLAGDVKTDTKTIDGTSISLPSDLKLDVPARPLIEGVAHLRLSKLLIRAAYFQAAFRENVVLDESLTYLGETFTIGTEVKTAATIHVGALDAEFTLLDQGKAQTFELRVSAGIGGRYLGFRGHIRENISGFAASDTENGIIPVVAANASVVLLNLVSVEAEIAGMALPDTSILRVRGKFLDASLEARLWIFTNAYVAAGYRFCLLRVTYDSIDGVDVNTRLKGLFLGVGIAF